MYEDEVKVVGEEEFVDETLVCKECGNEFVFTAGEQQFYKEKGFMNKPKSCKACRDAKKNAGKPERQYFIAVCAPGQISQVIYNGALRGAGDTKYVAFTSAICIGIIRPLSAYLLCYPAGFGLFGAWVSLILDQYMRLGFSMKRFFSGQWQKIKV